MVAALEIRAQLAFGQSLLRVPAQIPGQLSLPQGHCHAGDRLGQPGSPAPKRRSLEGEDFGRMLWRV